MAEMFFNCDVVQGFNFRKDVQDKVGFINSIDIGEAGELLSDLTVTDPEDVDGEFKVFGILSDISWAGGYAEPIQFSCQVSNENSKLLSLLTHTDLANTKVTMSFTVYDYDPVAKKYYPCFHSNEEELGGLVLKEGGNLAMTIDGEQSLEVPSPKNYRFDLSVMPDEEAAKEVHVAVSETDKFIKQWGVEVSA